MYVCNHKNTQSPTSKLLSLRCWSAYCFIQFCTKVALSFKSWTCCWCSMWSFIAWIFFFLICPSIFRVLGVVISSSALQDMVRFISWCSMWSFTSWTIFFLICPSILMVWGVVIGEPQYCSNNAATLGTPFFNFINSVVHNKLGSDGAVCTSTSSCRSCHLVSWHKSARGLS